MKEKKVTCPICKRSKKLPKLHANGYYYHGKTECTDREKVTVQGRNIREKCKVEIIECIYVDFTGMKTRSGYLGKDDGIVHKFQRFCLDNNLLGIRGPGGTSGPGVYCHCHQNREKKKIIEFFESEDIDVTLYTS